MIIGLCGIKGSGKSVVASYIAENYGFTRVNYKDQLIEHIKTRFPDILKELSQAYHMDIDKLFENKPPAMRALMVNVGTDDKRRDNENYWVHAWAKKLASIAGEQSKEIPQLHVVADDVRFQNEFDAIKLLGGVVIRIKRSDITDGGNHPSETEQFSFEEDFTIEAEPGGHAQVYSQIDAIMSTLNRD